MSKAESNQHSAHILGDGEDILRIGDIIPPYDKAANEISNTQKGSEQSSQLPRSPENAEHSKNDAEANTQSQIPSFELAEQIMAQQRKITTIKRKSPTKKTQLQSVQSTARISQILESPKPTEFEKDQIVAEIVTRDIDSFFSSNKKIAQRY